MSRRAPGDPKPTPRADGRWQMTLELAPDPFSGRRRRHVVYGRSERECRANYRAALARLARDEPLAPERQTVAAYLAWWYAHSVDLPGARPNTVKRVETAIRLHILPYLGEVQMGQLGGRHIVEWQARLLTAGCAPASVVAYRGVLHRALAEAEAIGTLARNPLDRVRPPRLPPARPAALSVAQARAVLAAAAGDRLAALWTLALTLGLRKGEALGLRWQDIDWQAPSLMVDGQTQYIRRVGVLRTDELKTPNSRQRLPLPPLALTALRAHQLRQRTERLIQRDAWGNRDGLIFTTEEGAPLNHATVSRRWRALLAAAGAPPLPFKAARSTTGSLLRSLGAPESVIMQILRHRHLSMTVERYLAPDEAAARQAAAALDGALSAAMSVTMSVKAENPQS